MIALIDGDIIAYLAVVVNTKKIDWGDGKDPQVTINVPSAIAAACDLTETWAELAGTKVPPIVCFSGRTGANFRKVLAPNGYKSSRSEKPVGYWEVVDTIENRFKVFRVEGLEADDIMGIAGTDRARFGDTVIVSTDKDMKTIPATIFNPNKDKQPRTISAIQADHFWMTQTLTGDLVDGYKGCPGVGPVTAGKILEDFIGHLGAMWGTVVQTYVAAGLTEADALLQARLARILRKSDYNRKTKEIQLWHLTKPETFALTQIGAQSTTAGR